VPPDVAPDELPAPDVPPTPDDVPPPDDVPLTPDEPPDVPPKPDVLPNPDVLKPDVVPNPDVPPKLDVPDEVAGPDELVLLVPNGRASAPASASSPSVPSTYVIGSVPMSALHAIAPKMIAAGIRDESDRRGRIGDP
jgi:hypothetical protein